VRQAVYELKKENIVTAAGRGKVKLVAQGEQSYGKVQ
jgi:hypothetical protein